MAAILSQPQCVKGWRSQEDGEWGVSMEFLCDMGLFSNGNLWSSWWCHGMEMLSAHYDDVIMGTIACQITSLTIVYSTVNSGADQSKHQSSASLAFVWGIHRGPVNSPHKWPVTQKMFSFDDIIMNSGSLWGDSWVTGGFPSRRPVMQSFNIFFVISQKKLMRSVHVKSPASIWRPSFHEWRLPL